MSEFSRPYLSVLLDFGAVKTVLVSRLERDDKSDGVYKLQKKNMSEFENILKTNSRLQYEVRQTYVETTFNNQDGPRR